MHTRATAASVRVTVSVGVCAVAAPDQLADPDELVRRADEALYRAKRAGRNRVEVGCAGCRRRASHGARRADPPTRRTSGLRGGRGFTVDAKAPREDSPGPFGFSA